MALSEAIQGRTGEREERERTNIINYSIRVNSVSIMKVIKILRMMKI